MPPRFFCEISVQPGPSVTLPAAVAHHALKVLRLASAEAITLFDGSGGEYPARLVSAGKQAVAEIGARDPVERESPISLTLVQCLATGDKMDWVLQKAVELGASSIAPVVSQRSVVRLSGERAEKRLEHWRQVVISACEQCGRNRIPAVESLEPLPARLARPVEPDRLLLMLAPGGTTRLADLPRPKAVELLVGPEGGFTQEECLAAQSVGYRAISLGPRILRTETAGLAALAAIQALWGDLG